jgi:Flp pilus assembly protein TadG
MTRSLGNPILQRRPIANADGSAAIEFGLVLPFLIALIYGVIELSRMLWGLGVLNFAVEQGARYAAVNCASGCSTDAAHYAASYAGLAIGLAPDASQFTVDTGSTCGSGVAGARVSVSVAFTTAVLQLLPNGNAFSVTLAAQSCYPT